jgi:TolA-binding protein
MMWNKTLLLVTLTGVLTLAAAAGAQAQVSVPTRPSTTAPGSTSRRPRQEPCWQVAGVSKSVLQQRRSVEQQARQEVEQVCANSSLSLQQKRAQIQQIHERERQQIDGLISPAQQEEIRSCQEQRHGSHGGHTGGGHGGPCGELSTGHKGHPMDEDEAPAGGSAKPD